MDREIIPLSSDTPYARSGHCMVADTNNVYIIGGYVQYTNDLRAEPEIWKFNLISHLWRKLELKNSSYELAASSAACCIGHSVFIHGGTGTDFGRIIDNSLIAINLDTSECFLLPLNCKEDKTHNLPVPTYGHSITYVELHGKPFLYKIGGVKSTVYTMNVYRYSVRDKFWECVSHFSDSDDWSPAPRYKHDTVLYQDKLYVIGGQNSSTVHPVSPVPVLDLLTHKWHKLNLKGTIPTSLKFQSSILVDSSVYIFGGIVNNGIINDRIYCLNLATQCCTVLSTHGPSSYFHQTVYFPHSSEIYCFGGNVQIEPTIRTNQLTRFRLLNRPLPLSRLAWNHFIWVFTSDGNFASLFRQLLEKVDQKLDAISKLEQLSRTETVLLLLHTIRSKFHAVPTRNSSTRSRFRRLNPYPWDPSNPDLLDAALKALALTLLVLLEFCDESKEETKNLDSLLTTKLQCFLENPEPRLSNLAENMRLVERIPTKCDGDGLLDDLRSSVDNLCFSYCCPSLDRCPRAQLPINSFREELLITAFFYYLGIPAEFIHSLPNGSVYFKFVDTLASHPNHQRQDL